MNVFEPDSPPVATELRDIDFAKARYSRAEPAPLAADSPVQALTEAARPPHPLRRPLRFLGWLIQSTFGIVTLIVLISVLAAIPIVNFLALGYLLEVEGSVARTGRFRRAFPLIEFAPRIGSMVLGVGLWLLPVRFFAGMAGDAHLISPGSFGDRALHLVTVILAGLVATHLCLALGRGGSFGCFFRPIKNVRWFLAQLRAGSYWDTADRGIQDFLAGLRLKHHFWLGLRGFAGAFLWLVIPTTLFAVAKDNQGPAILVTLVGGAMLVIVLSWLPFLQARFAAENRWGAMFELRAIRELNRKAPLSFWLATVVTFALALPPYLGTPVLPPRDALWMVTILFVVANYPGRVLVGWAYYQAVARPRRAWFGLRWLSNLTVLPLLAIFVFLLFFTQFIGSHGKLVLFEHHALLLPAPF
ncbi:MAG TPA: hypothetical protein VHB77_12560 [Planctomycetaceae bacterium]|nr:hypothetical protein [Planctomycetaceae bacterium]